MATLHLTGHASQEDRRTYRLVPFVTPVGTRRIDVRYAYPKATGNARNTIDIGIYDARGTNGRGFRGWSGSARSTFTITEREATPGYTAGPLPPGTWHILLGFYEIAPDGCEYTITVILADEPGEALPPVPTVGTALDHLPGPRADAFPGWLRGDPHCHTLYSDGDAFPADVLATARALGLDFLSVTDHNTLSHQVALAALDPGGLILIPGIEVTTYFGHANVWGLPGQYVEFRCRTEAEMTAALADAAARGGVVSLNHPKPHGPAWEFGPLAPFTCVEVWNGPWQGFNTVALAYAEEMLRQGRRIVFVGGSDMHNYHPPTIPRLARPTTWLYAPGAATPADLLAALRAGHCFLSRDPRGPQVTLVSGDAMMGDILPRPTDGRVPIRVQVRGAAGRTLQLVTERAIAGTLPINGDDETFAVMVDLGDAWTLRAQIVDGPSPHQAIDMLALTTPLFFPQPPGAGRASSQS